MKGKFTFLKMSLVGLFLMGGFGASAQTIYDYYACAASGSITLNGSLKPDGVTPYANYLWTVTAPDASTESYTTQDVPYAVPTAPGVYTITLQVGDECYSPVTTSTLYVLPAFTVSVTGDNAYCVDAKEMSELTAVIPDLLTLDEIEYTYEWYASNSDDEIVGPAISTTTTNTYDVPELGASAYYIVKAKYSLKTGVPATKLLGAPCEATAPDAALIEVTLLPDAPTITITSVTP